MPDDRSLFARDSRNTVVRWLMPLALGFVAGCTTLPPWLATNDTLQPAAADAKAHEAAQEKLHAAVQASQPGQARLTQARRALEQLLADERTEARALHPYARALLEQIRERQRLSALNERLNRELDERERGTQDHSRALEALREQNTELQRKLDALTEIERRLSPPVVPETPRAGGSG
jgi:chromosome segregation ATPase